MPGPVPTMISITVRVNRWSWGHPASERHTPGVHLRVQHSSHLQLASLLASPPCPSVLHPCPTPLLDVPSPGAGLHGPVSPAVLCCSPREELGNLGACRGPLLTPAGSIWPCSALPWPLGMGFTVSCAPFTVEPVPLFGHLGHGPPYLLPLLSVI